MIDESELKSILQTQIDNAIGGYNSSIESEQSKALDFYHGRKYGNEIEGRSAIVTRETLETIEWTLAQLLKIFASGHQVVQFDPVSEDDEEAAQQESDYVNHIFMKENDGFMILHDWFKDALLLTNGYVKVWVEDEEEFETQTYEGLDDLSFSQIVSQENAEPIEHEESQFIDEIGNVHLLHSIKIRIKNTARKIRVAVVPPEEIGISKAVSSLSLKKAPFVYHRRTRTVSDLIEAGYNKDLVESIYSDEGKEGQLEWSRQLSDDSNYTEEADDSMREIVVFENYIYIDFDGDGIAELRKICMAGDVILDNEEIDFIPFPTICPIPMPHKHVGLSQADTVMDLQLVKSVLMRQMLDNLNLTNNPEKEVLDGAVNIDDLLDSIPGGLKRVKQIGAIREIVVPFTAGASMPMLDILDSMRESRTGVSRATSGLDPDVLAKSTSSAFLTSVDQSNQLVEKTARIFAETGITDLFLMIHELANKYIDKEKVVRLNGKYVPINPLEWKQRTSLSVSVGLGTGDRGQALSKLMTLAEKQEQHLLQGSPLVSLHNLYNTYGKITETAEIGDVTQFFTNPDEIEQQPQEPAPDPQQMLIEAQMMVEQSKLQLEQEKAANEIQLKARELAIKERELNLREQELAAQTQTKASEISNRQYEAQLKAETQLAIEQAKLEGNSESERKLAEAQLNAEAKLKEAEIKASAEIQKAQIEASKAKEEKPQEVHIHNGGPKRISVQRTESGLEGFTEELSE